MDKRSWKDQSDCDSIQQLRFKGSIAYDSAQVYLLNRVLLMKSIAYKIFKERGGFFLWELFNGHAGIIVINIREREYLHNGIGNKILYEYIKIREDTKFDEEATNTLGTLGTCLVDI